MKLIYDLATLPWTVEGYTPYVWLFERMYGTGFGAPAICVDVPAVPAKVPGSVQGALRDAGVVPDWTFGMNSRLGEWVENRHWIYHTHIPDSWFDTRSNVRLECMGLDYSGWIYVNGRLAGEFKGTHIPHTFDITPFLHDSGNVLEIIFDMPPRWLGQFGYTSQMLDWKPRFNYTWDWTPRLVQVGIWDTISLVMVNGAEIKKIRCEADADIQTGTGDLKVGGDIEADESYRVEVTLSQNERVIRTGDYSPSEFLKCIHWKDLPIELWWPNLEGNQPIYTITISLLDAQRCVHDRCIRQVGFRNVTWKACKDAPKDADPWICVVNGRPIFLQGVNFAPIRSFFADLTREDYEKRLRWYQKLGCNTLRVNACQFLEREWFYELCDELGLFVWQELPLTSSGIDNWPPEDEASIQEMIEIGISFVERRQHHASLFLWSGGNELQGDLEGRKTGVGKPCDRSHPMLRRLQDVFTSIDPNRRFIPTSPLGPRAGASPVDFGKGLHWDVHGPNAAMNEEDALKFWSGMDALFCSEVYCSGSSSIEFIQKYAREPSIFPPTAENQNWNHPTTWWIDWNRLISYYGYEPKDLSDYVKLSQSYQAEMLKLAARSCKEKFPSCGGFLLWSGHDTSPMFINSSIVDYESQPKPAAYALAEIFHGNRSEDVEN